MGEVHRHELPAAEAVTSPPSVAIVGAGFGGIGTAVSLRRAGIEDIVVFERGKRVGGVWNKNTYPGAACDVPSHLYSYSFAPNPRWGRRFAVQPEIQRYVEDVAERHGVLNRVRLNTDVRSADWDPDTTRWRLDTDAGPVEADMLVCACGQLTRPAIPHVEDLEQFTGPAFHSSEWRHDVDLRGLRVGVLGAGASAIQFVPAIQPLVRSLTLVQRTPPWILPKPDRGYRPLAATVFERMPLTQRAGRFGWWAFLEAGIAGFIGNDAAMAPLRAISRTHLRRQVRDPDLRRRLTPTYKMGCKRVLISNDWYPALSAPNVEVVTDGIERATATGLVMRDGREVELDALIFGTGFRTREFVAPMSITGHEGRTLDDFWAGVPNAWHGLSVPGFPNMFLIYGPNTFGGSGSGVYMIESQIRHVVAAASELRRTGARTIEVRPEAHADFMDFLHERQRKTVWATGGCSSWYVDEQGRDPTNWPGYTLDYRRRTARISPDVYALEDAPRAVAAA
jgi:cation diffusion facilitator CzcD-associated flavoprotein CzcO